MTTCPKCQAQFDTDMAYRAHAISHHGAPEAILKGDVILGDQIIKPAQAQPIAPVPMPNIPPVTVQQFDSPASNYVPTTDPHSRPKTPATVTTQPPEPIKKGEPVSPKTIKLEYRYSGDCKDCLTPVITIFVTTPKKVMYATAVCPSCLKQYESKKIEPIL